MNELLLILVVAALLILSSIFLSRVKQPWKSYIRITSSVFLLVLVWGFAEPGNLAAKIVLTILAIYGLVKGIMEYRRLHAHPDIKQPD
jgi:disulfide bond formation protein DsbB